MKREKEELKREKAESKREKEELQKDYRERLDQAIETMRKTLENAGWEDKMGRLEAEKDLHWMTKMRQLEANWVIKETDLKEEKKQLELKLQRSETAAQSSV